MLKLAIVSLALLTMGCGLQDYTVEDEALRPHVEEFFNDCARMGNTQERTACTKLSGKWLTIKYVDRFPEPSQVGSAVRGTVSIRRNLTGWQLRKTVYHELAHAMFGSGHVYSDANCKKIMYTGAPTCIKNEDDWDASRVHFWLR